MQPATILPLALPQTDVSDLARGLLILTRYLPATDTAGSRVLARFAADPGPGVPKRATVPYQHDLGPLANHHAAALELLRRLETHRKTEHQNAPAFTLQAMADAGPSGYAFITDVHWPA